MFTKHRYDGKIFEHDTKIKSTEMGKEYLIKLLERPLTIDDKCELRVTKDNYTLIERDIPKNLASDYNGDFEEGTYFIYKLSLSEVEYLEKGRYSVSLRTYNPSESRVVFKEELKIS